MYFKFIQYCNFNNKCPLKYLQHFSHLLLISLNQIHHLLLLLLIKKLRQHNQIDSFKNLIPLEIIHRNYNSSPILIILLLNIVIIIVNVTHYLVCGVVRKLISFHKNLYKLSSQPIISKLGYQSRFGPYETDITLSFQERVHLIGQFYKFQTKAFEQYQITVEMAEQVLNQSYLVYRPYTYQLLNILQQLNIPLYIISGGISDSISNSLYALTQKHFPNISIHSNKFHQYTNSTTLQNNLLKFNKQLIHSYNKYKVMNHVKKRKNCFLMGDQVSDIYMAQGNNYDNVLSIFYAKQGENYQRTHAQKKFDIIVEGDSSHKIIIQLVKAINRRNDIDWKYLESTKSQIQQLII